MNVDDVIAERIAAARQRIEADRRRRAELEAARAEADAMLRAAFPDAHHKPAASHWADQLPARFITRGTPRCTHLDTRPVQPAFVLVWEGVLRCRACHLTHCTDAARAQLAGTYTGLGDREEGTCDRCRTYAGADQLTPGVARFGPWTFVFAACDRCSEGFQREGGQLLNPPPEAPVSPSVGRGCCGQELGGAVGAGGHNGGPGPVGGGCSR